jgi:hypothetical protein
MEVIMKKIAKQTYDTWATAHAKSFWANTINWGHAFCNEFNVEDSALFDQVDRMSAEIFIFEKYVDDNIEPEAVADIVFDWTDYPTVNDECKEQMGSYINQGQDPGGFLTSILCNDLINTVSRATDEEYAMLKDLVKFMHADMPYEAWGNHKAVSSYQRRFIKEN